MVHAMSTHTAYWDEATKNKSASERYFEHWRYGDGWHLGWCDAKAFFVGRLDGLLPAPGSGSGSGSGPAEEKDWLGADRIGYLDLWILRRMREDGNHGSSTATTVAVDQGGRDGAFAWEWEHGFRRGVADLEEAVGIS